MSRGFRPQSGDSSSGSVAKTKLGYEIPLLYLYLCSDTEDLVDERDLSCQISSVDILNLSFANHRHRFIPFESPSSCVEGAKSQVRIDQSFNVSMVLFNQIIEIFSLPDLALLGQLLLLFKRLNSRWTSRVLINIDHSWCFCMTRL